MSEPLAALVDTHCHLNLSAYDADREEVLDRARLAGVERILIPGVDLQTSQIAIELAEKHDEVFAAVGIHPHYVSGWSEALADEIASLAQSPKVVAIGEIGLDYYRNLSPPEEQRIAFEDQLEIASALQYPVLIHNREAIEDILEHLNTWIRNLPPTLSTRAGVLHAFSADLDSATEAIRQGFYIGIAGPITFPKAEALRSIVSQLPSDRLVIETDSPYLTPEPRRGRRNEPAHLEWIAQKVNDIRDDDYSTIRTTTENAKNLFQWSHDITNSNIL
ncbi:MAG: TatD family deoxyribonuclease [Anaerolineales bacterium]|nr:MAG: TatD family deoxyribonuclease [Anaerolineales bacterium]